LTDRLQLSRQINRAGEETMSRFWRHFMSNGHAGPVESRLGLYGERVPIAQSLAQRFELPQAEGVKVHLVHRDSPAFEAGLVEEDTLVMLGERPTTSLARLHKLLRHLPAGLPLPAVVLRGNRRLERWVILDDHANPAWRP
jgi:S1-C subfamily serine protease